MSEDGERSQKHTTVGLRLSTEGVVNEKVSLSHSPSLNLLSCKRTAAKVAAVLQSFPSVAAPTASSYSSPSLSHANSLALGSASAAAAHLHDTERAVLAPVLVVVRKSTALVPGSREG